MILLDENQEIVHDEPSGVSDEGREACKRAGITYRYAGNNILYHKNPDGSLIVVSTAQTAFEQVVVSAEVLDAFSRRPYAADANIVLREIAWGTACIYTDTAAILVPTEILK